MNEVWSVQDAKDGFNEFLEAALVDGPQIVTRNGIPAAVLVPIDQWQQREQTPQRNLKELLLAPEPRVEQLTPPSATRRRREPPVLD